MLGSTYMLKVYRVYLYAYLLEIIICQLFFIANSHALPLAVGLLRPRRVLAAISETHEVDDNQKQYQRNHRRVSGILAKLKGKTTDIGIIDSIS